MNFAMNNATLSGRNFGYTLWVQNGTYHAVQMIESGIKRISSLLRNIRRRRSLVTLLKYDDRMLHDMGLTRDAVQHALTLPLSANGLAAAKEQATGERIDNDTYWTGAGKGPAGEPHKYFAIAGIIR